MHRWPPGLRCYQQREDFPTERVGERLGGCRLVQDINLQKIILRVGLETLTASYLRRESRGQRQGSEAGRLAWGAIGRALLPEAMASEWEPTDSLF